MNNFRKNALIWLVILGSLFLLASIFQGGYSNKFKEASSMAYSDFYTELSQGHISEVAIRPSNGANHLSIRTTDGRLFTCYAPFDLNLMEKMKERNVRIMAFPVEEDSLSVVGVLLNWLPTLLLVGAWFFIFKQMQAGGNKAIGFGRSRAKMVEKNTNITFKDVAGIEEAKAELEEIVDFLRDPRKFRRLGGQIPRGVLLSGPPGTGKTLLAKAVAGEANVPFFSISGSDFVEMFVGVGASRVRDLFEQAKKNSPCIVFIDEIDAVGRHRGQGLGGGNDEREQTLNQLLVEMDGFEGNDGVIVVAATNRPDILDHALLRPGRFDRQISVGLPDLNGREKILQVHIKKVPVAADLDLRSVARGTPGFCGANLKNLVNEAALIAARQNHRVVSLKHFELAKDKILMGAEKRSLIITDEQKKLTAYHEAGHALVGLMMPASDPIHKATIVPRGRSLGMVMRLPETDKVSVSRAQLEADMSVAMGGRAAEVIIFGDDKTTTGASSDITAATSIARNMVKEWGMSRKMGNVSYADNNNSIHLGYSDETARAIDQEVLNIVDAAYKNALHILNSNIEKLHNIANALIEYETLTGEEIKKVSEGLSIDRPEFVDTEDQRAPKQSSLPFGGSDLSSAT